VPYIQNPAANLDSPYNLMVYFPEANILIGCEQDPHSKTPAFKAVPVNIEVV